MATRLVDGATKWSCTRDENGHREYKITHLVSCDNFDGPANALNTPGLPVPGAFWIIDGDVDLWAWCRWDATVTPVVEKAPNGFFEVEQIFSSKPPEFSTGGACKNFQVENPLLEPQKISGSFVKYTEEATHDRFGLQIMTSSFEQIRGPQVEFDRNRPTVRIEQNVADLALPILAAMVDCVNDSPLWGLAPRMIKLSNVSWERKYYGACFCYYTRILEFDINYETFDRYLLDEGNKVLNGHWHKNNGTWVLDTINGKLPNFRNPGHYKRYKDRNGENARVLLNGAGLPAGAVIQATNRITTGCCPPDPSADELGGVSKTLTASIVNKTSSAAPSTDPNAARKSLVPTTCLPGSTALNYSTTAVNAPGQAVVAGWASAAMTACPNGVKFVLSCSSGTSCNGFSLRVLDSASDDITVAAPVISDCACSPFKLYFYVSIIISIDGPAFHPTYRSTQIDFEVSITETQISTTAGIIPVQKYNEANFLLLGVPLGFSCLQ